MTPFTLTAPARMLIARDCRHTAADEIARLGTRVLLVRGRSVAWVDTLADQLTRNGHPVETVFSNGEPTLDHVRAAVAQARGHRADCVVSVGGGAAIDLGKAVAGLCTSEGDPAQYLELGDTPALRLNTPLPFLAMPTTAGTGAEATRNAVIGVPDARAKISLRDPRLVPDVALVDPALTDGAPKALTLASGLDALTQLIESYLTHRATPVTDALCAANIPPAVKALDRLMQTEDAHARDALAQAGTLSGLALANSGLGIVHGLASVIGGRGAPHGAICGRLLAPALTANRAALTRDGQDTRRCTEVVAWLADGFGAKEGLTALRAFAEAHGLPTLKDLGVADADTDAIARQASGASSTKANPVVLTHAEICALIKSA